MDIDIDVPDRDRLLQLIQHVPAMLLKNGEEAKHPSGTYLQRMPKNPLTGLAAVDYKTAQDLGFFKLDILNVHVYSQIKNPDHLDKLLNTEPVWELLNSQEFVDLLVHINGHFDTLMKMQPVDNVEKLAMFLAVIRPSKRHLIGKSWEEVQKTIWNKPTDDSYYFKKSHGVAYAHLVVVHMNLLVESAT